MRKNAQPFAFYGMRSQILRQAPLTPALIARLALHYTGAFFMQGSLENELCIDESGLSVSDIEKLRLDLQFFDQNPAVPLENICAHVDAYVPRNESQAELVKFANLLVELNDESSGAGIYMWGDAGIGKSHMSVALSKIFMKRGLSPVFMPADSYGFNTHLDLQAGQVWIIDDMNSGYGIAARLFKQVVLNVHERGGRMFVTSNKPYEELMREAFVGDGEANRLRYDDRTKGMFKIIHVEGDSYRQANAWYNSP